MDVMPSITGLQDQSFSAPVFCVLTFPFWCLRQATASLFFGTDGGCLKKIFLHFHNCFFFHEVKLKDKQKSTDSVKQNLSKG